MIGGIFILLCWGLPSKLLGLTDRTFYDWGMVLILYKPKYQFLDYTVGVLAHLGISGILGILFAGLIFLTSRRYLKFKGVIFEIVVYTRRLISNLVRSIDRKVYIGLVF